MPTYSARGMQNVRVSRTMTAANVEAPLIERKLRYAARSEAVRPLRVAMILYRDDLNMGGSLRVVETLARGLDPARVEAHIVFAYGGPGTIAKRAKVPCHFLYCNGPTDVRSWWKARRRIAQLDPDILHFHNPAYWLHAALIGKRYKKLMHMDGPYFPENMTLMQRLLMIQNRRLVDGEVCIARGARQMVLDQRWGVPDRTWTVYNGVDCSDCEGAPSKQAARAALGLPDDCLVIGMACRLAWYKGCQDAIRILRHLDPRWHLVFCGDGPMQKYLADVARQEGVACRTHFAGLLGDMRPAYAAMDAFLFLSRLEPFGLVIAEAMAARVPVFGLAAEGAYRDALYPLVTPENSFFLERANPSDYVSPEPSAVLNQLARWINDFGRHPESFRPVIERARQWVVDRFDAQVQAEAMFEVYAFAMGRPTDSPK
jgi:glycosyltransferase involved in cell wall biosynthesis